MSFFGFDLFPFFVAGSSAAATCRIPGELPRSFGVRQLNLRWGVKPGSGLGSICWVVLITMFYHFLFSIIELGFRNSNKTNQTRCPKTKVVFFSNKTEVISKKYLFFLLEQSTSPAVGKKKSHVFFPFFVIFFIFFPSFCWRTVMKNSIRSGDLCELECLSRYGPSAWELQEF